MHDRLPAAGNGWRQAAGDVGGGWGFGDGDDGGDGDHDYGPCTEMRPIRIWQVSRQARVMVFLLGNRLLKTAGKGPKQREGLIEHRGGEEVGAKADGLAGS